jgi:hypothetical protein
MKQRKKNFQPTVFQNIHMKLGQYIVQMNESYLVCNYTNIHFHIVSHEKHSKYEFGKNIVKCYKSLK